MGNAAQKIQAGTNQALDAARHFARRGLRETLNPAFLQPSLERATRGGQWLAAALLIVLVPITFKFIIIAHKLMVKVLNIGPFDAAEGAPWIVTLATLGLVILGAWGWFQWVRTAGFGLTNVPGAG